MAAPVQLNFLMDPKLPISLLLASTLEEQIDICYQISDNDATPKHLQVRYARLAGRLCKRL